MESSSCTDMKTDSVPDGTSDDECDLPDPRIQNELDKLNSASTDINRLENELDEARSKYRSIVSGTSAQMEIIAHGRKKSIQKAREYYKLSLEAKLAQSEALKAARQYQTAVSVYKAARETVALAESRLTEDAGTTAAQLTSAWQEMLNHAISKVTEAEKEKAKSEQNHKRRSTKYAELQTRIQVLEKKFARSIKKARPYFELKAELDVKLMQQKQNVLDLQAAIRCCKMKYTESLRKLEKISEEIHQSRREKFWSKIPRMPGVGADTDSETSGLSEIDLKSVVSSEWSEYGEEEFDSESVTDDEVFDASTELSREKRLDNELQNKMDMLCFTAKSKLDKDACGQTEDSVGKSETQGCNHSDTSFTSDSGINTGVSSECDDETVRPAGSVEDVKLVDNGTSTDTCVNNHADREEEEIDYAGCDMQSVERPSLSGEEEPSSEMKSSVGLILLLVVVVAAVANAQNASCRNKCGGTSPRLKDCFRADHLWRWDGFSCQKMPVGCYNVKSKDNAFTSVKACLNLCGPYSG